MRRKRQLLVLGSIFALSHVASPSFAQESKFPAANEPVGKRCDVFAAAAAEDQGQTLWARCPGRALILGAASSFETVFNEELGATLIDVQRRDGRHILLITIPEDGNPLLEDLTGQIARAAGRGPMSGIDGVMLDLKGFAATGDIDVQPPLQDQSLARADKISVSEQVALEKARRATQD